MTIPFASRLVCTGLLSLSVGLSLSACQRGPGGPSPATTQGQIDAENSSGRASSTSNIRGSSQGTASSEAVDARGSTTDTAGTTGGSGMDAQTVDGPETPTAAGVPKDPKPNPPGVGHNDTFGTEGMLPGTSPETPATAAPGTVGRASTQMARGLPDSGNDRPKAGNNQPGAEAVPQKAEAKDSFSGESVHCPPHDPNSPSTANSASEDGRTAAIDCAPGDPNAANTRTGKPGNP